MKEVGDTVHPWYRGIHEWRVRGIVQLMQPIEYHDPDQGNVGYFPRIILL